MDSHDYRVYSAEQAIDPGPDLSGIGEARALVRRARRSAWWSSNVGPGTQWVGVRLSGREADGWIESWAASNRRLQPTRWMLNIHPRMLNPIVVLHELAHTITPRHVGDLASIRRGRADWARTHFHGPEFTAVLAELVRRFGTGANHAELRAAYDHFEVPVIDFAEIAGIRAHSDAIEEAVTGFFNETDRPRSNTGEDAAASNAHDAPTRADTAPRGAIPTVKWGWWLRTSRRWRRGIPMVSREKLAEAINPVQPCTARDIRVIEESSAPVTDLRLRRIAMCAVAVLNLDGVWARTELGLARWDLDLEMDQLEFIAPDWARDINHLNDLISRLPPFWASEGAR